MTIKQNLNHNRYAYFMFSRFIAIMLAALSLILFGCDAQRGMAGLGSIAGMAILEEPDSATGHAGILVYLAGSPYQARTDQQGRYRIDGIPAGSYDLIAEKDGFQGQVIEGLMINPETHTSQAPLQPVDSLLTKTVGAASSTSGITLGTITGEIFLEGMPDENGGVRIELDGTPFVTVSNSNGKYQIPNVDPGVYTLSFFKEGYLPYTSENMDVTTGTNVIPDVALRLMQPGDPVSAGSVAASMAARAATPPEADSEPPPGPNETRTIVGIVELRDQSGQLISDYSDVTVAINGTNLVAEIDEQGQFRFDNLSSGTYTLIGTIPDGPVVQIPVDLVSQRVASVSVRMTEGDAGANAGGTIRGRVVLVDPDDVPLENASGVTIAVAGTQLMATTTEDGIFTISGVAAGNYQLAASKEKYAPEQIDVQVSAAAPVDVGEIRLMLDVDRPRVVSTSPENNARDVVVGFDLPITITFSDRMDPNSVRDAISLSPSTPFTTSIGSGAQGGGSDNTLVINLSNNDPEAPIKFGQNYRVTIAETAANVDGVTMEEPYSFSFRSAKPGVIQSVPETGSSGVYVDQITNPVMFTFNTQLDPESITERNFRVRPDDGRTIAINHTNAQDTGWTTVRIGTVWQPDTAYTVTVSRRVKAANGQTLGNTPYTIRFKTAPIEIMSVPMQEIR